MAIATSVAYRNEALNQIETSVGTSPKLIIYAGSVPVDCAASPSASVLATLTLPSDWLSAASGGVKDLQGSWTGTASATGTATHFRIYDSAISTCHVQGTVGTSASDMIVSSASITSGQTVTVDTFQFAM